VNIVSRFCRRMMSQKFRTTAPEPSAKAPQLVGLAVVERHPFGVLAGSGRGPKPEIGLVPLLVEVEVGTRRAPDRS